VAPARLLPQDRRPHSKSANETRLAWSKREGGAIIEAAARLTATWIAAALLKRLPTSSSQAAMARRCESREKLPRHRFIPASQGRWFSLSDCSRGLATALQWLLVGRETAGVLGGFT